MLFKAILIAMFVNGARVTIILEHPNMTFDNCRSALAAMVSSYGDNIKYVVKAECIPIEKEA